MKKSGISREEIDDRFDKCLKKAMNDTQQLVKGEVSEDELVDTEQGLQQLSVEKMIESFTKILLDNEKVNYADVNVQMHLKNVRSNRRHNETQGLDERGGWILRD